MGVLIKSKNTVQQSLTNWNHKNAGNTGTKSVPHGQLPSMEAQHLHTGFPEIQCNRFSVKTTLQTLPSCVTGPETWHSSVMFLTTEVESFLVPNWALHPRKKEDSPTIVPQSWMPLGHRAPEGHILLTT